MKSLAFSSLCFVIILTGCISVKPKGIKPATEIGSPVKPITNIWVNSLFKATLEIKKHRLTGLLLLKRMDSISDNVGPAEKVYRIVFTNEIGMTYFDLELSKDTMKVISCFASLNKKALMKILETDFQILANIFDFTPKKYFRQDSTNNLVMYGNAGHMKIWQVYTPAADTLLKTAGKSTPANPVFISYSHYLTNLPTKITLENPVIGMKISLRRLK